MCKLKVVMLLGMLFACVAAQAAATSYTMDPNHTQVRLIWNHGGFSNPGANLTDVHGTIVYDPANPAASSVEVRMPIAGLDAHVPALTEHLKGADFFDAAKFPVATFKSTAVAAAGAGKLTVTGNLSVHGVTRPVTPHVTINKLGEQPMWNAKAAGFDASATLKRSDFGVAGLVPVVSDEVRVHITTEAIESAAYRKATGG